MVWTKSNRHTLPGYLSKKGPYDPKKNKMKQEGPADSSGMQFCTGQ
jgi:hypothetical protein